MKLSCFLLLFVLSGCNAHQVTYDTTLARGKVQSEWTGHYLYGSIGHPEINVRTICPQGVAKIETYRSFGNGMIGGLTLGIYTPRTVRITCAGLARATSIAALDAKGEIRLAIRTSSNKENN